MRNSEFNNVNITNDKQIKGLEFGKTQKFEVTFQKENKLPDGELNEKYVGKTIRKQTEVNVKYSNTATAPAHGSTTVTSATTASNVAATTATVATAASVVAVTAIAVTTGISVVMHDYKYQFNSFIIGSDYLTCEILIIDEENRPDGDVYERYDASPKAKNNVEVNTSDSEATNSSSEYTTSDSVQEEEERPFSLRVYNNEYEYTYLAKVGVCEWTFTELEPNQDYHIALSENRFGGETLFDQVFTTKEVEPEPEPEPEPVSEFRGMTWDKKCNFLTNEMTVQLDYIDERNLFSDFKFNLTSEMVTATGPLSLTYDLRKTTEPQTIKLDSNRDFNLSLVYDYSFTYMEGEEKKTILSGESFQFEDNSGAVSKFNKFIFDKTANFKERTFDVQLDFVDDFNVYSDFVLTFYYQFEGPLADDHPNGDEIGIDVPLQKTTEVQTIDLDGIEISLNDSYKYCLKCKHYGEEEKLEEGTVKFTDNSGAIVRFNEFIFDETINYDTRELTFQLDYIDELDYLYGFEFTLMDLETEQQRVYYLDSTTEVQTVKVDEIKEYDEFNEPVYFLDPVKHRVKYSFSYWRNYDQINVVTDKECKFKNSLVSTFTGIDTPYDFTKEDIYDSYILPIRFVFDDAAHVYSGFEVAIYKDEELYGRLMFEGETNHSRWMNSVFTGMEGHEIDDVVGTPVQVVVSSYVIDDDNPGGVETVIYSETKTFTKDQKTDLYGVDLMDSAEEPASITYGQYSISLIPIFSGPSYMIDAYLVIECQSGNTYKIPMGLESKNQISYLYLENCSNFFEENFENDFGNPVNISVEYTTYHMEMLPGDSTTDPHEGMVPDGDPKTIVVAENYQFMLQA